jgi:hypothetical protein
LLATKKSRSPRIGSIRNDKINYDKDEQFFSKDDIPANAKTIKEEVKNLVDPDHLGLRKKPWNVSVSVPKNFEKEETHEQKLLKVCIAQSRLSLASRIIPFPNLWIPKYTPALILATITRTGMSAPTSISLKLGPICTKRKHLSTQHHQRHAEQQVKGGVFFAELCEPTVENYCFHRG